MMPMLPGNRGYERCDDCGQAVLKGKMGQHTCTPEQRREHEGREDEAKLAQLEAVRAKTAEAAMQAWDMQATSVPAELAVLLEENEANERFYGFLRERSQKRKSPAG